MKAKGKAKALLAEVENDVKNTRRFFDNEICFEENKCAATPTASISRMLWMNFTNFYQQSIQARVQMKLLEESENSIPRQLKSTPALPIIRSNLDDDDEHPPVLSMYDDEDDEGKDNDTSVKQTSGEDISEQ